MSEDSERDEVVDDAAKRGSNLWAGLGMLVLGMLVLPFGGLFVYGYFLPEAYDVEVSGTVNAPQAALWKTLTEPELQGEWRPGVGQHELADPIDGQPVVVLHTGEARLTLQRTEMVPEERVVWTVVPSKKHVYVGSWSFDLAPAGDGATHVTVTEHGEINSAFARAATHAFFGLRSYSEASIGALGVYHEVDVSLDPESGPTD